MLGAVAGSAEELVILGAAALAIGFVGGMVGLVLGVVRYPIILGAESSAFVAAGTNIGVSTAGAISGAVGHLRSNRFHLRVFSIMAVTGAAGGFAGSFATSAVPAYALLGLVLCIVCYESYSLARPGRGAGAADSRGSAAAPGGASAADSDSDGAILSRSRIAKEASIGLGVGLLGGMVGLVLGSVRLPTMMRILRMRPRVAVGTNLAASAVMGAAAVAGHLINGGISIPMLAVMAPAAMVGAYAGSRFTGRFDDGTLKRVIGVVLAGVAVFLAARLAASLQLA